MCRDVTHAMTVSAINSLCKQDKQRVNNTLMSMRKYQKVVLLCAGACAGVGALHYFGVPCVLGRKDKPLFKFPKEVCRIGQGDVLSPITLRNVREEQIMTANEEREEKNKTTG
ncbi:uncharacterized [Tachysurus ichikawai]